MKKNRGSCWSVTVRFNKTTKRQTYILNRSSEVVFETRKVLLYQFLFLDKLLLNFVCDLLELFNVVFLLVRLSDQFVNLLLRFRSRLLNFEDLLFDFPKHNYPRVQIHTEVYINKTHEKNHKRIVSTLAQSNLNKILIHH